MRPSFCKNCSPSKIEGAGNAGRLMRPRPRVRNKIKHTSVVTTVTPVSPGIPRAMVLTAYFVLSPATNSSCHRHPRSEEHTSELQSRFDLVCRLLLEKKKKIKIINTYTLILH